MTLGPNGSPGKVSQNRIARWMGEPSLPEVFQTHGAGMHGASSGKRAQVFLLLLGYRLSLVLVFCWGGANQQEAESFEPATALSILSQSCGFAMMWFFLWRIGGLEFRKWSKPP